MPNTTPTITLPRPKHAKPEKPWPDFPLYWHTRGYWMKRYDGRELRYEADAIKSHERWVRDRDAIDAGRESDRPRKRYALRDAVNVYLTRQKLKLDDGDISPAHFVKCRAALEHYLPRAVPLTTPLDNFRAKDPGDHGPATLLRKIRSKAIARGLSAAKKHMDIVRACLDYAAERKLMLDPTYADDFDPPSDEKIAIERNRTIEREGERTWDVTELRQIVAGAEALRHERRGKRKNRLPYNHHLYAQVLLALFAGYGSDDCSAIPERAINMKTGVAKWARAKTGRPTMAVLPKRVLDAVRWSLDHRAKAATPDAEHLLFRTEGGRPCNAHPKHLDKSGVLERLGRNDTIGQNFPRLLTKLKLKKPKTGFKTLRSVARTLLLGGNVHEDIIAVIMGRKFRYAVDDYYIRGELRAEMSRAAKHVESVLFPRTRVKKIKR